MSLRTEALFREDSYLREAEAEVLAVNERDGVILDRTIFYATSGGQPGDTGTMVLADGTVVPIAATVTGETKDEIIHVPAEGAAVPVIGSRVKLAIDWPRRFNLMRMHTACHLVSVICPFPITGASVAEDDSRIDLDIPDTSYTKELVTERLMEMVRADHPVFMRWITDEELAANPGLVKTMMVKPLTGSGIVRLVRIGDDLDLQPCGGTHVRATGEIGDVHVAKVEKKGRINRRFRIRFGALPIEDI